MNENKALRKRVCELDSKKEYPKNAVLVPKEKQIKGFPVLYLNFAT